MNLRGATRIWRTALSGLLVVAILMLAAAWYYSLLSKRNTIQELQELPVGSTVRLVGVVTCVDEPGGKFWMEDETGALPIAVSPRAAGVHLRQTVKVKAIKASQYNSNLGPASIVLRSIQISASRTRVKLPNSVPVKLPNLPPAEKNGARIQISAVVRAVREDANKRAVLSIADTRPALSVVIGEPGGDYSKLVNAQVRISGLLEENRNAQGWLSSAQLWVNSGRDLQIEQSAPDATRLYSIRTLFREKGSWEDHRIRIRGLVAKTSNDSILLEDKWGAIECHLDAAPAVKIGTSVEAEGFPEHDAAALDLFHSTVKAISGQNATSETAAEEDSKLPVISSVAEVRGLEPSQAARALPTRITGVITFSDQLYRQLWLQDESGGIYIKYSGDHPDLQAGTRITVVGITNPGDYAPVIVAPKFIVEGEGSFPKPVSVTPELAASGKIESGFVEMEGVVHLFQTEDNPAHPLFTFEMFTEIGQVHVVTTSVFSNLNQAQSIEDAKIHISGVFGIVFNSRRQLIGYQLLVAVPSEIAVIEPAVHNPFEMERTPIQSLLSFSAHSQPGHRVRVEGTVTLVERDYLYLQDSSGGVELHGDTASIKVGDHINALGYPTLVGRYSPVMTDAVFRLKGHDGFVTAKPVAAESILDGHEDSTLVAIEGKLLMTLKGPTRTSLVLQSGVRTFTAQIEATDIGSAVGQLREGSVLRLTGVCSTQVDPNQLYKLVQVNTADFQLLLRSPEDLVVIKPPPFWNQQRTFVLMGVLSLLIVLILLWVGRLRRRVREQVAELKRASETAQALRDLSLAMQSVSKEEKFDTEVSVQGSEDVAQLVVGFNTMIGELRLREQAKHEAEAKLQQMALIDELTGLPNRRLLFDRLAQSLARARRDRYRLALLYIDLDGFKLVNDNLGHAIGDIVLCEVAKRLRARSRESDTVARIGGDEFTVVLDRIQENGDAVRAAEGLLDALRPDFEIEGNAIQIGASIGISIFPDHGDEGGYLLQQADCAMYAAKKNGKNRMVLFGDNLGYAARERITLESELRRAMERGEISIEYQPEFDLGTNSIVRFEALARWTHPTLGSIPPLDFIPIAEECGLIVPLGSYIMERACRDAMTWQKPGERPIQVAVNVSSVQFARDAFFGEVEDILHRTGIEPGLLQIELTESTTLDGVERVAGMIDRFRKIGISVALDGFGTGYSCLGYLPLLGFNSIKIDRTFVSDLMRHAETQAFAQSIVTMAHNLKMRVVVEGIESVDQLDLIRSLGANEAQGYLKGRPTPDPMTQLRENRNAAHHPYEPSIESLSAL
jgi:diguanylate cyclase (GGDEF)-like protein